MTASGGPTFPEDAGNKRPESGGLLKPATSCLDAALFWIDRKFLPVPVGFRSKRPYNPDDPDGKNWQGLRITKETAVHYFNGTRQNIGVLLGDQFGSADIDLDSQEAIRLAPHFLPETRLKFGHASKRAAHWFYRSDPPIPSEAFKDPIDGTTLLELRCQNRDGSIGHQTVVPPSVHESGEEIQFEPGFDQHPANVEAEELLAAARKIAAAALMARYWPAAGEGRHKTMLALAGLLYRAAWNEENAVGFCLAGYRIVPDHDPTAIARTEHEVRDTYRNAASDRPTTGIPTLRQHFDQRVVSRVFEWLGVESKNASQGTELILNDNGAPKAILANAVTVLRSDQAWSGVLAFNEFAQAVVTKNRTPWGATGTWTDHDDRVTTDWLQRHCGLNLQIHVVSEAVQVVARENGFDPLLDYLKALEWDGTKQINNWLALYLGAESTPYTAAVGERWLISAVARAYQPACKADCVLILEGPQGLGKSRALRILGEPWFTDEIADLGSKDAAMQLLGIWIVELAELDSMRRADVSKVKAVLSRSTDRFRPPYGRRVMEQPRRSVFAGTVNAREYLRDETGNRRFRPVECRVAHLEELQQDRDQIWAEAVYRFKNKEPWWLDDTALAADAAEEQAARLEADAWEELVEPYLSGRDEVTTGQVLKDCLGKDPEKWGRGDEMRVGAILRGLKWERTKRRISDRDQKSERCYRRRID